MTNQVKKKKRNYTKLCLLETALDWCKGVTNYNKIYQTSLIKVHIFIKM